MENKKFIVKVQLSIASNKDVQSVLVYNEDESILAEYEATDDLLKFCDGREKFFVWATLDAEGGIVLGDIAPWQQW